MKTLFSSDFVIVKKNETMKTFFKDDQFIIFGDKQEAIKSCLGKEKVISTDKLSKKNSKLLKKQIKNY
jgi:hypothetical protein